MHRVLVMWRVYGGEIKDVGDTRMSFGLELNLIGLLRTTCSIYNHPFAKNFISLGILYLETQRSHKLSEKDYSFLLHGQILLFWMY